MEDKAYKNYEIEQLKSELLECKNIISNQNSIINAFNKQRISDSIDFSNLINEYNKILNSRTWRFTEPIRSILNIIKGVTVKDLRAQEVKLRDNIYNQWINYVEKDVFFYDLDYKPLISIIIPVYDVDNSILIDSINSVDNQIYSNWELIIIDDCSKNTEVLNIYKDNPKINIIYRKENGGISKATNDGLKHATGEYVAFLDCDDVLSLNALQEVALAINTNRKSKLIYSDYDIMSNDGTFKSNPFFKPDYSPDLLWWNNYFSHFCIYKKTLIDEVGLFDSNLDGSQDYDYVLRCTEHLQRDEIYHIDKVLYHWRQRRESVAFSNSSKPYAIDAASRARENALVRRKIKGHIDSSNGINKVVYDCENVKVSIIIPSKDNFNSLKTCIDSIKKKTKGIDYEIIVVDNGSNDTNKSLIEEYLKQNNCRYIYFNKPFNFSYMCNVGAKEALGDALVFMNDDIEVINSNWLSIIVGQAMQPHTGAVGVKLYYPNSRIIQHCGVGCYLGGPGHYLQGMLDDVDHYYSRNYANYNVLAVTAACMAIEKKKYIELNGFNEDFNLNYNDVDLCMRLYDAGYYNVMRNDVIMFHHESMTRSPASVEQLFIDKERLYKINKKYESKDPFYNRNLPQFSSNFDYERDLKLCDYGI